MSIEIAAQTTPNPNTLKFIVNQILLDNGTADFTNKAEASESPLAAKLFDLENVTGVFVGTNFVTVTKSENANWEQLSEPVINTLRTTITAGGTLVTASSAHNTANSGAESEIETKIKQVLDQEIRPAVAMDGGDITFHSYNDGIVTLHLRGACSQCPSATMTLKMGVEARLKEVVPEVKEVVQI